MSTKRRCGTETELEARLAEATRRADDLARINASLRAELAERRGAETAVDVLARSGVVGVLVVARGGTVLEANDTFLRIVGYSRQELVGRKGALAQMTPPDWRDVTDKAIHDLYARGAQEPWEKEYFRKDGTRAHVLLAQVAISERATLAFVVDLSERRRAEEVLRSKEEQLRQAQKMEAVGRLAGGVAHDFNNMLSVILSYGTLLAESFEEGSPNRADLEEICAAATRAASLTKQLLLFSRQEMSEPRAVDLNGVVGGVEKILRRTLGEDVTLVVTPGADLGAVRMDPTHLEQVLMNLAVNARDAMPGGGSLAIATANLDEEAGRHVLLTVTDSGTGMDAATKARIFEPFFTTKERGKGTGLGLSTVFGIVERSGGVIDVQSQPGKGTTFRIRLPRIAEKADEERPQAPRESLRGAETILLVEDEDQVRTVLVSILRRQGYRVLEAKCPLEAIRMVGEPANTIDLLLTDVVMPEMSGPELARRVAEAHPGAKVLCISGYTDDLVRKGVAEGGFAFLQKPITPDALARKVREVIGDARAA